MWGWCYLISITWNPITVKSAVSWLFEKVTTKVSVDAVIHKKHVILKILHLSLLLTKKEIYTGPERRELWQQFQGLFKIYSFPIYMSTWNAYVLSVILPIAVHFLKKKKASLTHYEFCLWISAFHVPVRSYSSIKFWDRNCLLIQLLFSFTWSPQRKWTEFCSYC